MSNNAPVSKSYRQARRSTRIEHAIPLKVSGLDCFRAPYMEEVSTATLNCHGCKLLLKNEVLPASWIVLELSGEKKDSQPTSVRALVKSVLRPFDSGVALFQTAVEFESPGNVWGIDSPPSDWLSFGTPRTLESADAKSKPFAVPKPAAPAIIPKAEERAKVAISRESKSAHSISSDGSRTGELMGEFQRQMEKMLSEAAMVAVQERTASTLDGIRADLREEAKRVLSEMIDSQARPWIGHFLEQMKQASKGFVQATHSELTKRIEGNIQQAIQRIEVQQRELEECSRTLAENTLTRVQELLEASRKDAVDRIASRLKEQMAPQIDQARKVTADLAQRNEQVEKIVDDSIEKFSVRIEKACDGFERQFESILRARMDTAREEIERAGNEARTLALDNLRDSSKQHDAEAQARLRDSLDRVAQSTLAAFKEEVSETSRQFAGELANYSRSHLEFVGSAISGLAKGIGKQSKD